MRLIPLVVALLCVSAASLAAAEPAALPPEAQRAVDKADTAIAAVDKATSEQVAKIRAQAIKDLTRLLDAATKKPDADLAKAIQQRIDAYKEAPASTAGGGPGASAGPGSAPTLAGQKQRWADVSATVISDLEAKGQKIGYPGKAAGISVDPATGELYMAICDQGIWKSKDHGATFVRVDDKHIGGRCETGSVMQWDPAGGRLACFMLDGLAGMTLDGGKTWTSFGSHNRGWDFGAVDWSAKEPTEIFALHHESGGEVYRSSNAGKSWSLASKDGAYVAVGIFDATTLITAKNNGGIQRSTDNGKSWTKVADFTITNHVMQVFQGTAYLISKQGLVTSTDRGATWTVRGAAVDAAHGPIFFDSKHMVVWNGASILETLDGGTTWTAVTPVPDGYPGWNPAWYINVGWDRGAGILYASKMGNPAFRWGGP